MSKLDPLHATVDKTVGVIDSAIVFIVGLIERLHEALSSDDVTAEVEALTAELEAKQAALAQAIAANPGPSA
jgi:predicted butyrate kinase (DUF1464 family)